MVDIGDHRKVIRGHGEKGKQHDALQDPTILANDGWQKHALAMDIHIVFQVCVVVPHR